MFLTISQTAILAIIVLDHPLGHLAISKRSELWADYGRSLALPNLHLWALRSRKMSNKSADLPRKPGFRLPHVRSCSCSTRCKELRLARIALSGLRRSYLDLSHGFPEQRSDTFPTMLYVPLPPDFPPILLALLFVRPSV